MADTSKEREYGQKWMERIRAALARDEEWVKVASEAEAAYSVQSKGKFSGVVPDFNILHSNVETIVPAIYNSTPNPDIRERWVVKQDAPEPLQGPLGDPAQMGQAPSPDASGLPQQQQQPQQQPDEPERPMKMVAQMIERAITVQIDDNALDAEVEDSAQDAFLAGRGVVRIRLDADEKTQDYLEDETQEQVTVENEKVLYEVVPWKDYLEGSARRFEALPWVAFRHWLDHEAVSAKYKDAIDTQTAPDQKASTMDGEETGDVEVWEVWCKETKNVKFIRASDGVILETLEDPMGLTQFYPHAKPVVPIRITSKRTPVCPYEVYRHQAKELDRITKRINAILGGLKVKGGIAGAASDIAALAEAGDNELVPIQNVEGLAQTGGLDKAIVWWPVDQAIKVLQQLYVARDSVKQTIYEITGISDIVRGASNARETLGAQQLKTQWGSVRIKKMQTMIERQVRDLFFLTAECIAKNFTLETLSKITAMEITDEMAQILESGIQQYRIDVESDSTIRADLSRMKGEMAEFLKGTASFFQTMAPVVAQSPKLAKPVVDLYSSFARVYNLGKQAEDAIEEMGEIASKEATQPQPNPAMEAQKADAEAKKAELQMKQGEAQAKAQEAQAKGQLEMGRLMLEKEKTQADLQLKQEQLAQADRKAQTDAQLKSDDLQIKQAELQLKSIDREIKQAELDFAERKAAAELLIEQQQQRAAKIGN